MSLGGVKPPVVRLRLWLETEEGMFFGTGRGMLLEAVERNGSLKKAAEELGMSYRAAWGKIRASEKVLGVMLIEQAGSKKGGHNLTPAGRLLVDKFRQWYDAVEGIAVEKAREIFPWECRAFGDAHKERKRRKPAQDDAQEAGGEG
ncbi:winged helix-turn-helix domain-containing protein [Fundidesulfovibrio agrisoli]|uniref:winged helix-turn-helix domain-containing protein n=1 Tax=Fundidesulfovibrio agrisoli TaxID=2922717 RepID=UPI001FAE5343|nr:LysR family transcriptional regulator [Fundidesulfovibrio agrisoli]